tara:strand:+ start:6301 stop:8160 length:1860 start_codon:yes stop_codon:yes gene_type:complete
MILIIGTGTIAIEYIKCLKALENDNFEVIGNTNEKCNAITNNYNCKCYSGGVENFDFSKNYSQVIIATPIKLLFTHLRIVIEKAKHVKNILIEKPGSLYNYQIKEIINMKKKINIFIAYNRRFYNSVIEGKKIIKNDKIEEIELCINEYNLDELSKIRSNEIMENYFTCMTTHVVDLTFFLAGIPKKINSTVSGYGELDFHKKGSIFNGTGITDKDVNFKFHGDWRKSGKWKLDLKLKSGIILSYQPLEDLKIINLDKSTKIIKRSENDEKFKPGYYEQVKSFLSLEKENLLTIEEQYNNLSIYYKMLKQNPNYYNILLIGCGNIGYRHLQGFLNTKLPLNIHIVEINNDNIVRAKTLLKDYNSVKINFYDSIKKISEECFDICTIATCSDIRLSLVEEIISNNSIKYICSIILEKITFNTMEEFEMYKQIIKKYKSCETYISSMKHIEFENKYLNYFKDPKVKINGGNWGLLCNSIHFIIFLLKIKKGDFRLKLKEDYKLIDSKRKNFKEIFGSLYNDDIEISSFENEEPLSLQFQENNYKMEILIKEDIIISFFENNKLVNIEKKDLFLTSIYYENEYKKMLTHNEITLCDFELGYKGHSILFECLKELLNRGINIT